MACKICILIPARAGSKGIKNKNSKLLAGKPLISWAIDVATQTGYHVCVSTDCSIIKTICKQLHPNVQIIDRPKHLADDHSPTEDVISHFLSLHSYQTIILFQPTSPLVLAKDITQAVSLHQSSKYDTLLSVTRKHIFLWDENGNPTNYNPSTRPRRQDWTGCLVENGAFYIFTPASFSISKCRISPPCELYILDESRSLEIDTLADWQLVESILYTRMK